jgi:hypothetical protein
MAMNSMEIVERLNTGLPAGRPLLTYRQLDHWCLRKLVRPLPRARDAGSGILRSFDEHEVAVITLLAQLVDAGLRPAAGAQYARLLARASLMLPAEREVMVISISLGPSFKLVLIWPEDEDEN